MSERSVLIAMTIRFVALCAAIAVACWVTGSGLPLFALMLYPSMTWTNDKRGAKGRDGE